MSTKGTILTLLALPLLGACTTVSPGSRPDDMSAARHRTVATKHDQKARSHRSQYDPNAERRTTAGLTTGGLGAGGVEDDFSTSYNPTDGHLSRSKEHAEHARQHRAAAQKLEGFEQESCKAFSAAQRPICPLLGKVAGVVNTPKGVRIDLAKGAPRDAMLAHMKCHYAFGRKAGRVGMDACPLYLKGLQIQPVGARSIQITSDDPAVVPKLRQRSKQHVSR